MRFSHDLLRVWYAPNVVPRVRRVVAIELCLLDIHFPDAQKVPKRIGVVNRLMHPLAAVHLVEIGHVLINDSGTFEFERH